MARAQPGLVLDLQELYRFMIDIVTISFVAGLKPSDFAFKTEAVSRSRMGKRQYLKNELTREYMQELNSFLDKKVDFPRMKNGRTQSVNTLIDEECLRLARFIRGDDSDWTPQISLA